MGMFSSDWLADLLMRLPAVLWALSFHEFCHGWMAHKLGDNTAAHQGRLSLNPLDHLDPIGTLMLIIFKFGWAKPVPINSRYFKKPRRDIALVSIAGAAGNFLTAFVCGLLIRFFPTLIFSSPTISSIVFNFIAINIGLGVFNLIPIPPLDGSKLLAVMLPPSQMRTYFFLERYGMFIIMILVFTNVIQIIMGPIFTFMIRFFVRTVGGLPIL